MVKNYLIALILFYCSFIIYNFEEVYRALFYDRHGYFDILFFLPILSIIICAIALFFEYLLYNFLNLLKVPYYNNWLRLLVLLLFTALVFREYMQLWKSIMVT